MSDSVKSVPIIKDKNRFMQKYFNRRERRLAKEYIRRGEFEVAESALVPHGSYDVCDWVYTFCWGMGQWVNLDNPRTWHKLIGK